MSLATTKAALKTQLQTLVAPDPVFAVIYTSIADAISIVDFPAAVIVLPPGMDHSFNLETVGQPGLGRHDYMLYLYVLVGSRPLTRVEELHARAETWIEPLQKCLAKNVTLSHAVTFLGSPGEDRYFDYRIGEWTWGESIFYGPRLAIPVTEKTSMTVG